MGLDEDVYQSMNKDVGSVSIPLSMDEMVPVTDVSYSL